MFLHQYTYTVSKFEQQVMQKNENAKMRQSLNFDLQLNGIHRLAPTQ
jgi:hypothetical protein